MRSDTEIRKMYKDCKYVYTIDSYDKVVEDEGHLMQYGVVILAGGKSTRMGTPKYRLRAGGLSFLDRLVYELGGFSELLVSVDDERKHADIRYPMVSDKAAGCGPMGGICVALEECISDALVTVPCDVPYFSKAMAERLCAELDDMADAVVAVTEDGREHPLCGVYKKSCLDVFVQCIGQRDYKMLDALAKLRVKYCHVGKDSWRLYNVNTPEDFAAVQSIAGEPCSACIAICGWKNSGKTTLIQNLIPILKQKGYKVAAIKHDGHSFEPDVPGTDSYRFFHAGADISAVYDSEKYSVSRRGRFSGEEITKLAQGADIVLMEGFKESRYPKIEVVRSENGGTAMEGACGRIAYVSDAALSVEQPVFASSDVEKIAAFVIEAYESGSLAIPAEYKRGENE